MNKKTQDTLERYLNEASQLDADDMIRAWQTRAEQFLETAMGRDAMEE